MSMCKHTLGKLKLSFLYDKRFVLFGNLVVMFFRKGKILKSTRNFQTVVIY